MRLIKIIKNDNVYRLIFRLDDYEPHIVRSVVADKAKILLDYTSESQKNVTIDLPRPEHCGTTLYLKVYTDKTIQYKASFRVYAKISNLSIAEKTAKNSDEENKREIVPEADINTKAASVPEEIPKNIIQKDIQVDLSDISSLSESLFSSEGKYAD